MIEELKKELLDILKDYLVGIYIHGSIAFGCFNENKSDIDLIVVVKDKLSLETKKQIVLALIRLNQPFEMSVVLEKDCVNFNYPTPYELHYSLIHKEAYLKDLDEYIQELQGNDYDLAAHFTVIKRVGKVFYGKKIEDVFGEVKEEYYLDSIVRDLHEEIKDAKYAILNVCRVLAYVRSKQVLSKLEGGKWGFMHLDEKELIALAIEDYTSKKKFIYRKKEVISFVEKYIKVIEDEMA